MSPWVFRSFFYVALVSMIGMYQLACMPFGWPFLGSVTVLSTFGIMFFHGVLLSARRCHSRTLFNGLVSLLVGFGAAAFLVQCCHLLFQDVVMPRVVSASMQFLLPFALTIVSFESLKAFPSFRAEAGTIRGTPGRADSTSIPQRRYVPDQSALEDGRVVDLAKTGIFDGQIVVPTFLPRELKIQSETGEEVARARAKKALDALRRLESLPNIGLSFKDFAVPESLELNEKVLQSAREAHAAVITNELSALKSEIENGHCLAIDSIANALRPPIPKGELLAIKIQRLGKEPKQGIGYLEDGTMVVVNGGGDFLGQTVKTQVLSQKYSSSGKIVFCNVREDCLESRISPYCQQEVPYCTTESSLR